MQNIRAKDCLTTPWKNGGGSTTEIAVAPPGAPLDHFDWRISMARVASDGPFSEFSGIERTLAVIKGNGLALTIGTNAAVTLSSETEPVHFPGDVPTSARLTNGEIIDLNVMTRRGRFSHRLKNVVGPMSCDFGEDDVAVIVSLDGQTTVTSAHETAALNHGDAAVIHRTTNADFRLTPTTGRCYLVLLREHRDG